MSNHFVFKNRNRGPQTRKAKTKAMAAAISIGTLRFTAAPVELGDAGAGAERKVLEAEFVSVVAALVRVSVALVVVVVALAASVLDSAPLDSSLVGSLSTGGVMVTPAAEQAAT